MPLIFIDKYRSSGVELTYWILYDSHLKIQSEPLSREEAQFTLIKIQPALLERYYIWTPGWENWQNLSTYLSSDQKIFISSLKIVPSAAPVPADEANTLTYTKTSYDSESRTQPGISLQIEKIKKPELDFSTLHTKKMKKRAARYNLQLEILLITKKGLEFRCRSVNISVTGVLLDEDIPLDFYNQPFDLLVLNKMTSDPVRSRVKVHAKTVGQFKGKHRRQLQFRNPTSEQILLLKSLLDEYLGLEKHPKAIFTKVS